MFAFLNISSPFLEFEAKSKNESHLGVINDHEIKKFSTLQSEMSACVFFDLPNKF